MTYGEQADSLLRECEDRAIAYMEVVSMGGQTATYVSGIKKEWQKVEIDYLNCLTLIQSGRVKMNDLVPEPVAV